MLLASMGRQLRRKLFRKDKKAAEPLKGIQNIQAFAQERVDVSFIKPWIALDALRQGAGSAMCWYSLWFRLIVGQELTTAYYSKETQVAIAEAFIALRSVRDRFDQSNHQRWKATAGEVEMIRVGLDLTDRASDDTSQKEKFDVHAKVQQSMAGVMAQH